MRSSSLRAPRRSRPAELWKDVFDELKIMYFLDIYII